MAKQKQKQLFEIRKVQTKNGIAAKVQFDKDVEITIGGVKVDLGEYRSFFLQTKPDLEKSIDRLHELGYIDEAQVEKRKSRLEEKQVSSALTVPLKG